MQTQTPLKDQMTKEEIQTVRDRLQTELLKHQILGFDYVIQAIHAIRTHDDWVTLWDCQYADCADLVKYGNLWKQIMNNSTGGQSK